MRMTTGLLATIVALTIGGRSAAQTVGPNGDRYELRLGKTKGEVYGATILTLTDSTFRTTEASADAGVIRTDWRSPEDVMKRGLGNFLKTKFGVNNPRPVKLSIVIAPIGADSTRLIITGRMLWKELDNKESAVTDTERTEWSILKGIGDAILKSVQ